MQVSEEGFFFCECEGTGMRYDWGRKDASTEEEGRQSFKGTRNTVSPFFMKAKCLMDRYSISYIFLLFILCIVERYTVDIGVHLSPLFMK